MATEPESYAELALPKPQELLRPGLKQWAAVVLLMVVGVLNLVDRFLPSILAQPIKQDLLLSDTALGFINGFGFLVVYAVLGIPIARLSDRGRYGAVISACVALWSVMTMIGGLAATGWQLALSRMGVALGEAGNTPAAHAYISRTFPADRRASALAVLTLSVPIANVTGLVGGGLIGEALGWRMTFIVLGVAGLVLAPLVILVLGLRIPRPVAPATPLAPPRRASTHDIAQLLRKKSFLLIMAGSTCIGISGYSLTTFAPAFLMRAHDLTLSQVGLAYGLSAGAFGVLGLVLTGVIADRLSSRDPRWLLWVVALMIVILAPVTAAGLFVRSDWAAIGLIAVGNIIGTAYMVPVVAAIQRLTPPELRATASAVMLFFTAILGGAGPLVTGMISDTLQPSQGDLALGFALLVVPAVNIVAALLYTAATASFRAEAYLDAA